MQSLLLQIHRFLPDAIKIDGRERARSMLGAMLGIFIAGLTGLAIIGSGGHQPWLVAPMGASAVLVFAAPHSPLAQPWSVIGGDILSAIVGFLCAKLIGTPLIAGSVAVSTAIGVMFLLRCLHPPGGAVALGTALGGQALAASGFVFAVGPVALNCIVLVAAGLAYNKLCGRRYPYLAVAHTNQHQTADAVPSERLGVTPADLEEVMRQYNQVLDISPAELEEILMRAEAQAYERRFGKVTCEDIMSKDVITVQAETRLQDAWRLLNKHEIKGLPVINRFNRVVGIVTRHDFVKQLNAGTAEALPDLLRRLLRPGFRRHKVEVIGDIMTSVVQMAYADESLLSLVPLFSDYGRHHLPIVDRNDRLVGILTQSDVVAALYRSQLKNHPQFSGERKDLRSVA
jgi:CBS domain-containing membrane protein